MWLPTFLFRNYHIYVLQSHVYMYVLQQPNQNLNLFQMNYGSVWCVNDNDAELLSPLKVNNVISVT